MRGIKYLLFMLLLSGCDSENTHEILNDRTVQLVALNSDNTALIEHLKKKITAFYGCKVTIIQQLQTPSNCYIPENNRYSADSILKFLLHQKKEGEVIQGLMETDICTAKNNNPYWGVFGLGYCPGSSSVISTFRIEKKSNSKELLLRRMTNVSLHELGHNFGLAHCKDSTCLMKSAKGLIKNVSDPHPKLCDKCSRELKAEN
ncbi:MAG: archaemetzincin [Bacteroidota bacterium]